MASDRKTFYTFIAVLLLVVAIIGAVNLTQPSSAAAAAAQSPAQPCVQSLHYPVINQTTLSNGTEISQSAFPVFTMSPASTMALCVNYGGSFDNGHSGPAYNSAYDWGSGGQLQPAQTITTSASPAAISIGQGQSTTVEYTVAAAQNATGFYGLVVLQLCGPIPLAIGQESSQINSSDFPGLFGPRSCPAQILGARIVGYTGANIAYLKVESRYNPRLNISSVSVSSFPTQGAENITLTMNLQSFSEPIALAPALNQSIVRVFGSNPELTTLPVGDYCSWYPNNVSAASNGMNISTFQDQRSGFMQVDAPVLQLGTYSNATYTISILISGPIANYTAIDLILYGKVPGSLEGFSDIVAYFPVSVSGQLQRISGSCNPD
jgi:hypothetical protein